MAILLNIDRQFEAFLDQLNEIAILVPKVLVKEEKAFYIEKAHGNERLVIKQKMDIETHMKYVCQLNGDIQFGQIFMIVDERGNKTDLQIGSVIRTSEFDKLFAYEGNDLGAVYSKDKTTCKVWAPTATNVKVRLYHQDKTELGMYNMVRCEKGTWSVSLEGDFEGCYYTYLACINLIWREAVDPYAKAVSINGEFGVIVDKDKTAVPSVKLPLFKNKVDAIIYEAHIRDFSIHEDSGMVHKGKYEAWLENNTKNKYGATTGVAYLSELGVTHIELLPVNDFEEVDEHKPFDSYNWGYNPLHFFAPEGSYSMEPNDPYKRITELKSVVKSLHDHGLRVILDVVYNHVYLKEDSSFEKLLPGYYFRYDANGIASNGTGVGNDLASERFMVRKFIIDCANYWMNEFDIDGFRFDLMGILDVDTMDELQKNIYSLKPDAILLGEGWDLNTPLPLEKKAIIRNAQVIPTISFFNDQFRDVIKGSTFSVHDRGFVYANLEKYEQMKSLISGSPNMFSEPEQSINYVESHDNHTMWDRLLSFSPNEMEKIRKARHRLATSMVILSQGVPFIHAGQEFFRTKNSVENSYNSPDEINLINWSERSKHKENVEYVKGLIQLRKLHGAFRLPSAQLIKTHLVFNGEHPQLLSYQLQEVESFGPWCSIYVVHNNHLDHSFTISLPNGKWQMVVDPEKIILHDPKEIKNEVKIYNLGTYVFCKI
ncbi:MAG: type I pullulanase [Bacillota bacterium]